MKLFAADMHIHTVLSPCAQLEMSPVQIVSTALEKELTVIGITDHNHTGNCQVTKRIAIKEGLFVLMGAEITTREEVHCLAYFEDEKVLSKFQDILDKSIVKIKNDNHVFGYQVIVDEDEIIVSEIEHYLGTSIHQSLEELFSIVAMFGGICIPAHIDRTKNSIYSQLGLMPEDPGFDALEISWRKLPSDFLKVHPEINTKSIVRNSDAHQLSEIGRVRTIFEMEKPSFTEIKMALLHQQGRKIYSE